MTIYNPHDESLVAENVQVAGQADVDAAVAAARAAFYGEWSKWTGPQRSKVMLNFADILEKRIEEIESLEAKAMGQPIMVAKMVAKMTCDVFRCTSSNRRWPVEVSLH